MHNLKLYIVPCKRDLYIGGVEKAVRSFWNVILTFQIMSSGINKITDHEAEWFGYVNEDEWIDKDLAEALPKYLESDYDCLVLYKKVRAGGKERFFFTPRIFRHTVKLDLNLLPPEDVFSTRVLDGWLIEAPS